MTAERIVVRDVTDEAAFAAIPPCADGRFDHRTCDYWEDELRGSKVQRAAWLASGTPPPTTAPDRLAGNPFAPKAGPAFNPFARGAPPRDARVPGAPGAPPRGTGPSSGAPSAFDPFGGDGDAPIDNPFAPPPAARPAVATDAPRKLQLLARGIGVFGSYAKVLEVDGEAVAYCQFGPLSAYPRARRVRDLYPQLPASPLPAVITCIATAAGARGQGRARRLVEVVTADLASRGFAAVEAYPEPRADSDATSAANPAFWLACGFALAVDDPRFPVVRREL